MTKKFMDGKRPMKKWFFSERLLYGGGIVLLMMGMSVIASFANAAPPIMKVTIGTFYPYYSPKSVEIGLGTSISWENPTADLHSITHDACQSNERCAFGSGPIGPNRTFTLNQLPSGYYPYHCSFHPIMRGILVVHESNSPGEI